MPNREVIYGHASPPAGRGHRFCHHLRDNSHADCGQARSCVVPGSQRSLISWSHSNTTDAWRKLSGRSALGTSKVLPAASFVAITSKVCRYRSYSTRPCPMLGTSTSIGLLPAAKSSSSSTSPSRSASYSPSRYGACSGPANKGLRTQTNRITSAGSPWEKYGRLPDGRRNDASSPVARGLHFSRYSIASSIDISTSANPGAQQFALKSSAVNCGGASHAR